MTKVFNRLRINMQSAYFRILVSTLTVTLIPLILIYIFISVQTLNALERQSEIIDSSLLARTRDSVEQTLSIVQQDANALANSRNTISFVFLPEITDHTIVQRLGNDLASISSRNPLISSVYVYSAYQGKVVTSDYRYYSIDEFYDSGWLTFYQQEPAPLFWTQPRAITDDEGNTTSHISLIVHVPSTSRKLSGAVVFNISADNLDTTLLSGGQSLTNNSINILDQDLIPLLNKEETLLLLDVLDSSWLTSHESGSRTVNIKGNRHLLTYTYSSVLGWYFIRTAQIKPAWDSAQYLGAIICLFFFIFLIACLMAVYTSRRLYNPVKTLVETVTGQELGKTAPVDEYGTIQTAYSRIKSKNSALETEITELQPLLRERYFLRLLRGSLHPKEQDLTKFGFSTTACAVFLVRFFPTPDQEHGHSDLRYFRVRDCLESVLTRSGLSPFVCIETSGEEIATVINFKESLSPTEVRRILLSLSKFSRETLSTEIRVDAVTGFSPLCHSLSELPSAFIIAQKAVRFKLFQENDDVIQEDDELLAPYTALLRDLQEQMLDGQSNYVRAVLEEIFLTIRQNLEALNQFQIQQIATHILNNILELLIQKKLKPDEVFGEKGNLFSELRKRDDINSIYQWLEYVSIRATAALQHASIKQGNLYVAHIKEYIEQHISDDISLNDVATWAGISPAYASRTFKENTGQNFVEYLNICRVEQAKQLLQDTQLSIKDIGFRSGFNSMQSFIRSFKKLENCTPSQYRDKKSYSPENK